MGESTSGGQVRGEFAALRKVARLASDSLASFGHAGRAVDTVKLGELRAALDDLERRYPYTLEPVSLAGELNALINDDVRGGQRPSSSSEPLNQAGIDLSPERL